MSEKALELLSTVDYKEGILAGVPSGIVFSHKFGERQSADGKGNIIRQLHDCGIIYNPGRPYLLCIMTRGDDFKKLSRVISSMSGIVYKEIVLNK